MQQMIAGHCEFVVILNVMDIVTWGLVCNSDGTRKYFSGSNIIFFCHIRCTA